MPDALTRPRPIPRLLGMDLRGHLDLMLLSTLARVGPAHGYGLIVALRLNSDGAFDLPEGTVYPALHRLERMGVIASSWDSSAPRKRRIYTLTVEGRATMAQRREEWTRFAVGMKAIVGPLRIGG
jgi:PadR family transcriptional regulator PadR